MCDKSDLAKWNDGVKFWLTVIDTFSRFVWVKPIKSKQHKVVAEAMREIFQEMSKSATRKVPERCLTDRGGSVKNENVSRDFNT